MGEEQQNAFEEIKHRLIRPPILHVPNHEGRFHLYLVMSEFSMGSALYQIQNGKPKLIAYMSKRLPEAARNYLITESELCSLAINIASFSHLLKRVNFDAIVDHLALNNIINTKVEPATIRIKKLLELISSYSCHPHDIISISFNMYNILHKRYYNLGLTDKHLVQTQSHIKSSR